MNNTKDASATEGCARATGSGAAPMLTLHQATEYEVFSSWWSGLFGSQGAQDLIARYFSWKTQRKFKRYQRTKSWEPTVRKLQINSVVRTPPAK